MGQLFGTASQNISGPHIGAVLKPTFLHTINLHYATDSGTARSIQIFIVIVWLIVIVYSMFW